MALRLERFGFDQERGGESFFLNQEFGERDDGSEQGLSLGELDGGNVGQFGFQAVEW
jgi:hypothetical protein